MPSDRYRLIAPLGRGASATVHLAEDTNLRRQVAVKVLHDELAHDAGFQERFRQEAQSAASLNHPNIMAVHDWSDEDESFLVMEYLGGGSLRAMLDEHNLLSPSQVIAVGLEACRGLHYAHEAGLVHRDIKPANLLFGHEGRLRIADFGLARAIADSSHSERSGGLVGTAKYASPEQVQGDLLTASSDVYSLGLVLIEAIAGNVPFATDTAAGTMMARVEGEVAIPANLPEKLADALTGMTRRNPEERLTSTKAGVALLKAAEGLPRPQPLELAGARTQVLDKRSSGRVDTDDDATQHVGLEATQVGGTPVVGSSDDGPARRWPWLLVTALLIAGLGWLVLSQLENALPEAVEIPAVRGLERDAAREELGDTWVLVEKFNRVSDVPAGEVIRTDPPAGEVLDEGAMLEYWVSLGPPLIRVPEDQLVGRSRQQAISTLEDIGLTVGTISEEFDEDIGAGLVMSITASASELPEGDSVDLLVSLGAQLRRIAPIVGVPFEQYTEGLATAGLGPQITEEYHPEIPVGEIISVTPEVGEEIAKGATVDVVVSRGPEPVAVPATSGLDLTPAIAALNEVGLLAGELGGSELAGCQVVGTDPPEGTMLQPGNPVTIIMTEC